MSDTEPKKKRSSVFETRRDFILLGLATVGAAWAGSLIQFKLFPSEGAVLEAKPVEIPLSEVPVGGHKEIEYGGVPTVVLRTAESVKAFSLVCTHLGCIIEWQPSQLEFYCPCHDGRFDQFGEVISGPPPVPLEQFSTRIEADKIIVGDLA